MTFACPRLQDADGASGLKVRLAQAAEQRADVWSENTVLRWVAGSVDGFPGAVVDRYADWVSLSVEAELPSQELQQLAQAACELGARGVYLKRRVRTDLRHAEHAELAPPLPILGAPAPDEVVVSERDLRFAVRLHEGLSTGLFIDQRQNRQLLHREAKGARLLNLFAYTCSFSVAAALGGARETVSIDISRRALARGKRNLELNDERKSAGVHRFIKEDVLAYLPRALRRGETFDWVVLDPPSFGTGKGQSFQVQRDYGPVARDAFKLLSPRGRLLCVTNHRGTSLEQFQQIVTDSADNAGRELRCLEVLIPASDCAPSAALSETKSLLVTVT